MTKRMPLSTTSTSRIRLIAIVGVLVGLSVVVVATGLDWAGFVGGMAIGAGIGVMLIGVYFWGYANGLGRPLVRSGWRPSEGSAQ